MKKNYVVLFILICFSITIGKAQTVVNNTGLMPSKKITFDKSILNKNKVAKSSSFPNQGWFNYGTEAEFIYSATSVFHSNYLFPDTMGYANFAGTISPMWIHHIAELVDFKSQFFSVKPTTSWVATSTSNTFTIDSLSLFYYYTRNHPNPAIIDTLIITIYDNSTLGNFSLSRLTNVPTNNLGTVDTVSFQEIGYNPQLDIICAPTVTTSPQLAPAGEYQFKVLLTGSDTAITLFREKKFSLPIPFSSSRNNLTAADVSFKPGYTYTLTQRIDSTANAFQFISREENDGSMSGGALMNHIDCNYGSSSCEYSMSYVLPKEIRYSTSSSGWNNRYIPAFAYNAPFLYEHHLISFHLIDTSVVSCLVNSQFSITVDSLNPGIYNAYETSTGNGTLSYLWDFGDGNTSTQHYPSHQYAVSGQYIVCLTVTSTVGTTTCSSTYCDSSSVHKMAAGFLMSQFNVVAPITTGINQTEKTIDIKAYPNPISDELIVEFTNKDFEKLNYVLIDALGRTILSDRFEKDKITINTSQLSKGIYNLNIINADGKKIKSLKIIK